MAKLKWSQKSAEDLELIHDYIATDSPFYARVQIERIFKGVERLRDFPQSGRSLPEFPLLPYRELIIGSYRCIYRFDAISGIIMMVTVVHGSRLLKDEMLSE